MIQKMLAKSFNVAQNVVSSTRIKDFNQLASQVYLQERESLYTITRYAYSGEGDVWDIGCAAGGSSFCLAAGIHDNESLKGISRTVKCFDLFDGYSGSVFKGKFSDNMSDLDIFYKQTETVRDFITAEKLNLLTELESYELERPIEVAHIDAAKSLKLWKSIFTKISGAIIPNKTIWIFQDFERCRLPWQIYSIAEMMKFGEIIGSSYFGTVYFKFHSKINSSSRQKIIDDDFTLSERVDSIRSVFDIIRLNHISSFSSDEFSLEDIENTAVAYCYYLAGEKEEAKKIVLNTSAKFLSLPGHKIYSEEIVEERLLNCIRN